MLTSASQVMKLLLCALQPSDIPFAFEDRAGAQLAPDSDEEQDADAVWPEAAEWPAAAEQPDGHKRRPVWQDPDDEAVQIDVAAQSQLRKLRQAEEQTVLAGWPSVLWLICRAVGMLCTSLYLQLWLACY